jgi:predicted RNase H-like HicB family nuclease
MKNTGNKIVRVVTCMGAFDCIFTPNDPQKGYTVTVPKLKGVVTFGDTEKEATVMAKEAIELHCGCLLEKGLAEVRPKQKIKVEVKMRAVR